MIKTKPLLINLMFTLVSIILHAYLTHKFYGLHSGVAGGESLCNLNSTWNCDAVSSSKYASFWGAPLALWALALHLVYALTQVMVLVRQDTQDNWAPTTGLLTLVIVCASLVMGGISLTLLKVKCLFCVVAYVISFFNLGLIQLSGISLLESLRSLPRVLQDRVSWGLAISIPVAVFIFGSNWSHQENDERTQGMIQDSLAAWQAAPLVEFDSQLGLRLGASAEQAKMTIVEFADFRCGHCQQAAAPLKAFTLARPDVALIFKAFPLDGTCNLDPVFQGQGDGISCHLAYAVMCAEKLHEKGWDLYSSIFREQETYQQLRSLDEINQKICSESGAISDCESFKSCVQSEDIKNAVQRMAQEGSQAKIRGTPTIFVNGRLLNGGQFLKTLEKAEATLKGPPN